MLSQIQQQFMAYYEPFAADPPPAAAMHALKLEHTRRVVADAGRIIEGEGIAEPLASLGLAAAWLHDIGRFSQFRKYGTFSDLKSEDHARLSRRVTEEEGILDALAPEARESVLTAIEVHNRKEIPADLPPETAILAHLVRDADKLDIFSLLDQAIAETAYLPEHPEIYWNLPYKAPPSPSVIDAILAGRPIDYAQIGSFCDFVFIQIGWLNGGLHFPAARRLARERRVVETREAFLVALLPESAAAIRACCDAARRA